MDAEDSKSTFEWQGVLQQVWHYWHYAALAV